MGQVSFTGVSNYVSTTSSEVYGVNAFGGVSGGGIAARSNLGALLLEVGADYLLLENGSQILLE